METGHLFISHATRDDGFVRELRVKLETHGLPVWVDSRNLRGGAQLQPEIEQAIAGARQVIVVLSPNTINSPWVRKEIRKALEVERARQAEGYRVVPLLLPGVEPSALENWFDEEPLGVRVQLQPGGLDDALPDLLAALGERRPDDFKRKEVEARPVEDLVLLLQDAGIERVAGKERLKATATLVYEPADPAARRVESRRYPFVAPLGPIETEDLRWYLESYHLWPVGVFQERAEQTEQQLPQWGQELYRAVLAAECAREAMEAWKNAAGDAERRFSVRVDSDPPEGADEATRAVVREAASGLLSLPWELLHDGRGWLFQGRNPVRVRRQLPSRHAQKPSVTSLPIRVLLVSPRPEDEETRYIDHRASARPLVEAVENLGELVELTVLAPPTFPALQEALQEAAERNEPFHVVHFDGHGVYDRRRGLGALCFEDPHDLDKLRERGAATIHAEKLAELARDHRIPLTFLDACQTARAEEARSSVAAKLLEEGVTSVVAMSHSVLVETARRFVQAFYRELADGARVGRAMLAGQNALFGDDWRGRILGAGDLRLQDWFVPVLYQEEQDPQLVRERPSDAVRQLQARARRLRLGELPDPPKHQFHGRSRELLALERLLHGEPWAVVRGVGGAGKTALAVELARWLVRTGRFDRAAFVSMEQYTDVRGGLDALGQQLLPGQNWSVAQFKTMEEALQPVERALRDHRTLVVLDNLESVLPDASGQTPAVAAPAAELFSLCQALLAADSGTRLVFTSRAPLPVPFDHGKRDFELGALSQDDAIALVSQVMAEEGLAPRADDPGRTPQEITDLVEAVHGHARALVLLAREVARRGVRGATADLRELMAGLDRQHPGDRENSLYASVELSLRRLAPEAREQVRVLGVFHGGANVVTLAHVLGVEFEVARQLAADLIEVGLGEDMGYMHLRLDPALPPYLAGQMDGAEREAARARWAEGMRQLAGFLYGQLSQDAQLAARLTLLELPNLLALLDWTEGRAAPEEVVDLANSVETLLANLGRPQAMARATAVRERAAVKLGEWSYARFLAESSHIDRLLERGDLRAALDAAQQLVQHCLAAGEGAYPEAAYELPYAHWQLGRALCRAGAAEAALPPLTEAQSRFQRLADEGNVSAERMASAAIEETGHCLLFLRQLDQAAAAYEEALRRVEKLGDVRSVAVNKGQLGTVRLLQRRYAEALEAFTEARGLFASLNEPGSVATAWHQIGMVHEEAGQFEPAEQAYRQSLAIKVREKNRSGEAATLGQLGNLYDRMGRREEAVTFYRQAADVFVGLKDRRHEGVARSNAADTLLKLGRYDEARREILRAFECGKPFGHAAEPWKAWDILHRLEQATGHPQAVLEARQQAIQAFLAYRRAGGENQSPKAMLYALVTQALQENSPGPARRVLDQLSGPDAPPWAQALVPKLHAILHGDRRPALAEDPALDYDDAVELQLLLEGLRQ